MLYCNGAETSGLSKMQVCFEEKPNFLDLKTARFFAQNHCYTKISTSIPLPISCPSRPATTVLSHRLTRSPPTSLMTVNLRPNGPAQKALNSSPSYSHRYSPKLLGLTLIGEID